MPDVELGAYDVPAYMRSPQITASHASARSAHSNVHEGSRAPSSAKVQSRGVFNESWIGPPRQGKSDDAKPAPTTSVLQALTYGLVSGIVLFPVMIGFAHIIFQDPFFAPYWPQLEKLVLVSSIVHQAVFTASSTLPFAVGQVQDAGLIFLSAMASSCVEITTQAGASPGETVATTLVILSLATVALGVALWVTGYFKLASMVQYLPQPVIGGYLAFIGFYCGLAGIGMMTNQPIDGVEKMHLLANYDALRLLFPGVVIGFLIYAILLQFHHFAILPTVLVLIPVGYYIVLAATGTSLEDARQAEWMSSDTESIDFLRIWTLYDFPGVHWGAIFAQIPTWFGMYFVVAFSSSLDVAAIQFALGRQLDFDHELMTVGLSNSISGILGGFSGSYIFSQTIFTMRTGLRTRLIGSFIAIFELGLVVTPFSILAYVPKLFFGAVLVFIAIDLCMDHLVYAAWKMPRFELLLSWLTFVAINFVGLNFGMLAGIGCAALQFVLQYASTGRELRQLSGRSLVIWDYAQQEFLAKRAPQIVALQIRGYIFFGSGLNLFEKVKKKIIVHDPENTDMRQGPHLVNLAGLPVAPGAEPTAFLLVDFAHVVGLDTTAISTCFRPLLELLRQHNIKVIFTAPRSHTITLQGQGIVLSVHGAYDPPVDGVRIFDNLDLGLEWCEHELLSASEQVGFVLTIPSRPSRNPVGLTRALSAHLTQTTGLPAHLTRSSLPSAAELQSLEAYFCRTEVPAGRAIFQTGETPDAIYVIEDGVVQLAASVDGSDRLVRYMPGSVFGALDFFLGQPRSFVALAVTDCVIWQLTAPQFAKLLAENPTLGLVLQLIAVRGLCRTSSSLLGEVLNGTGA